MKPYMSIIVPVHNAENTILDELLALDYVLSLSEFSREVIVVDDASKDGTPGIIRNFQKILPTLRGITRTERGGMGRAIKDGMAAANGNVRLVLFPSCTGFLDRREEMIAGFKGGAELVAGTRNKVHAHGAAKVTAQLMRRLGNKIVCGKAIPEVSDARFGGLCMTEEFATWAFAKSELSDRNEILFQLMLLAHYNGRKITEISYERDTRCACGTGMFSRLRFYISALRMKRRMKKEGQIYIDTTLPN